MTSSKRTENTPNNWTATHHDVIDNQCADREGDTTGRRRRETIRMVGKDGCYLFDRGHVQHASRHVFDDLFTTIVETRWRYNVGVCVLIYALSWLVFALAWWLLATLHGDTDLDDDVIANRTSCVAHVTDFQSAFLFSVETQHTIGYGYRYIDNRCSVAIVILTLQCIVGALVQAVAVGLVFAKFARAKQRTLMLRFSERAVISINENRYQLSFRVVDASTNNSSIIGATVRIYLVEQCRTTSSDLRHSSLKVSTSTRDDCSVLLSAWPVNIVHPIDSESPLWNVAADQMVSSLIDQEFVVVLEGIVDSTGMSVQARTSYLPSEILWAHSHFPLAACRKQNGRFSVDYTHFNDVISVRMPRCSAADYHERCNKGGNAVDDVESAKTKMASSSFSNNMAMRSRYSRMTNANVTPNRSSVVTKF